MDVFDPDTGELLEGRIRISTPRAPTPEAAFENFGWRWPRGCFARELISFDLQERLSQEVGNVVRGVDGMVMVLEHRRNSRCRACPRSRTAGVHARVASALDHDPKKGRRSRAI